MAKYGLAVIPLIKKLASEAKQVWYADDATGGGKLQQLRRWWDKLNGGELFLFSPLGDLTIRSTLIPLLVRQGCLPLAHCLADDQSRVFFAQSCVL